MEANLESKITLFILSFSNCICTSVNCYTFIIQATFLKKNKRRGKKNLEGIFRRWKI